MGSMMGGTGQMMGAMLGMMSEAVGSYIQNRENRRLTRHARKFQERMYRHRYRYTVEDMKAAGLNPMLAVMSGAAGSPPAGPQPIPTVNPTAGMSANARSFGKYADELKVLREGAKAAKYHTKRAAYDALGAERDAINKAYMTDQIEAVTARELASSRRLNAEAALFEAKGPRARLEEQVMQDLTSDAMRGWNAVKAKVLRMTEEGRKWNAERKNRGSGGGESW